MSELLNQDDIDALIRGVGQGTVPTPSERRQIFSRTRRAGDHVEIRPYDFRRPERISKDQMRSLRTLHESFARNFGASLSGFLRTIVEVHVSHVEQMTYAEFIGGLPNPTSFSLIHAPELDGTLCLEVSPLIIYPVIDRLLGGSNQDLVIPQRPTTLIEARLIQTILQRAMTALSEAWESVREIRFELGEMESNPQIMQIVPPNEVVVVVGFEIKMANRAGTMGMCLPFNVIEPFIEHLSSQSWLLSGKARGDQRWAEPIRRRLRDARIELAGVLAETTITIEELRHLEVGDVITTDRTSSEPLVLTAEGVPKFLVHLGQYKDRRALRVVRPIEPGERHAGT